MYSIKKESVAGLGLFFYPPLFLRKVINRKFLSPILHQIANIPVAQLLEVNPRQTIIAGVINIIGRLLTQKMYR